MKQFMFLIIWIVTSMLMPLTAKSKILIDYNTGSIHTDKYISQFKDYDLYIVRDNSKYFYDGTVLTTGIGFTNGGFLNLYEFNVSKDKSNDTYLFTGSKYWTMTNATEGKYTIDPTTESKYKGYAESEFFGVRITQYTQDEVEVSGTGEYFNPWVFIPISRNHTVTIRTATKTLKEQTVNHGSNTNIDVALEDAETAEGAIVTCYYINSTKSIEYTSSSLSSGSTLTRINITDNMSYKSNVTPFMLTVISETLNPALTYNENINGNGIINGDVLIPDTSSGENSSDNTLVENHLKDESIVNINISNELLLGLEYSKDADEEPTKIILNNIRTTMTPKKGTVKFYGIVEGDNYTYIDLMRKHEITKSLEYNEDILNSKLVDGKMAIMFSTVLEKIMNTSYEKLNNLEYKGVMRESNILSEDLNFSIEFDIVIHTKENVYALPFEYVNNIDIYGNSLSKQYIIDDKIYFIKIK